MKWLQVGDENTAFFHRSLRLQQYKKKILKVKNHEDVWCSDSDSINRAFIDYYQKLFGSSDNCNGRVDCSIVENGPVLSEEMQAVLELNVTSKEIKRALFSIPGVKAPAPDGYNSSFFKRAWEVVGDEVVRAVQ